MRIESLHSSLAYFPDLDRCWRPEDLEWTEQNIRSLLSVQSNDQQARSTELWMQLARVRALRSDLSDARTCLEHARAQMREDDDVTSELRYLLEHGRVLALAMSPQKAAQVFLQAWDLAVQSRKDFFAIDAAVMLSTILPAKSQNIWLKQALQLVHQSQSPDAKLWLPQINLMAGWQAYDVRRFEDALLNFQAAIDASDAASPGLRLFRLLWSKARALRALGRVTEALDLQMSILDQMQTLGIVNAHVYLEIAECKQLMKEHNQARTFFELAHTALSRDSWYVDNRSDELDRMKYLFKKRN